LQINYHDNTAIKSAINWLKEKKIWCAWWLFLFLKYLFYYFYSILWYNIFLTHLVFASKMELI
jgi:hypothetical protein